MNNQSPIYAELLLSFCILTQPGLKVPSHATLDEVNQFIQDGAMRLWYRAEVEICANAGSVDPNLVPQNAMLAAARNAVLLLFVHTSKGDGNYSAGDAIQGFYLVHDERMLDLKNFKWLTTTFTYPMVHEHILESGTRPNPRKMTDSGLHLAFINMPGKDPKQKYNAVTTLHRFLS